MQNTADHKKKKTTTSSIVTRSSGSRKRRCMSSANIAMKKQPATTTATTTTAAAPFLLLRLMQEPAPKNGVIDLDRFRGRPEMLVWRCRANEQRIVCHDDKGVKGLSVVVVPSDKAARTRAVNMFILLLVSCPNYVDAQVVSLAVQYLDRIMIHMDTDAAFQRRYSFLHVAAACISLAAKWERCETSYDFVGIPKNSPAEFNRIIDLFRHRSDTATLTPKLLGRVQLDVFSRLGFNLWLCTPVEWMVMVRNNTRAAAFAVTPFAFTTDPEKVETWPSESWLRTQWTEHGSDPLPTRGETTAALERLPLEEQLLLHALREPSLCDWTPCRMATACMAVAQQQQQAGITVQEMEAARLCTMPNGSAIWSDARIQRTARNYRSTARDISQLRHLFLARQEEEEEEDVDNRIPAPRMLTISAFVTPMHV